MARWALGVVVVAIVASGCTFTHRCAVPPPVVEAAPGPRLPGAAAVRYAPPAVPPRHVEELPGSMFGPGHRTIVDADPPTRALFDRLAASMFERSAAPEVADAWLEVRLDRFAVAPGLGGTTATVAYHVALRSAGGAELAAFDVAGVATVAPALRHLASPSCRAREEAVAAAMQDAGARLVRDVSGSDAVTAWLAGRGLAPVALRVKTLAEYEPATPTRLEPEPADADGRTPAPASTAPPAPRPVDPGPPPGPLPPRSMRLRGGLASYRPQSTTGKLESPSRSLDWTVLAAEGRIAPGLRVDVDLDFDAGRSFDPSHVPHLTGFGPRATLTGLTTGIGLKLSPPFWPRAPLEPWIGASARLFYTKLQVTYFNGLGGGDTTDSAWTLGADLGAGVNLFVGAVVVGFDVRWRVGRASLAPLGSVAVGGLLVGGSVGVALPP